MKRALRALVLLATSSLVVCGVKGPPRPAQAQTADAGPPAASEVSEPQLPGSDAGER